MPNADDLKIVRIDNSRRRCRCHHNGGGRTGRLGTVDEGIVLATAAAQPDLQAGAELGHGVPKLGQAHRGLLLPKHNKRIQTVDKCKDDGKCRRW